VLLFLRRSGRLDRAEDFRIPFRAERVYGKG